MEPTPESSGSSLEPPHHLVAFRTQLRDLTAILALPAVWSGRGAADIRAALLEVLSSMLRLHLAYIRAADPSGSPLFETARVQGRPAPGSPRRELAGVLGDATADPEP